MKTLSGGDYRHDVTTVVEDQANSLIRMQRPGGVFEFYTDTGFLAGKITACEAVKLNGPWRVEAGRFPVVELRSWTAATFYLRSAFVELTAAGEPRRCSDDP